MRRATIRTELPHADIAARSVEPDNTPEMDTRVEDGAVTTTIERDTTGGLRSTVDDYVVNLTVASTVTEDGIDETTNDTNSDNHE